MDTEQEIINLLPLAAYISHRVWSLVHGKGSEWEDFRAEAFYCLVTLVRRWKEGRGFTLPNFVGTYLRKHLYKWAMLNHRNGLLLEEIDWTEHNESLIAGDEQQSIERDRIIEIVLNTLPENQREVIIRRFGLDGIPQSYQEIGEKMNMWKAEIRRTEKKAITSIQKRLRGGLSREQWSMETISQLLESKQ